MGIDEVAKVINGYHCIIYSTDENFSVLQYSPFDGRELPGCFLWELQIEVSGILQNKDELEYKKWCKMLFKLRPSFDVSYIPHDLMYLLRDRSWFDKNIQNYRNQHKNGEFCGGMSGGFIDDCYECQSLPKLACVPIQYCPFCGAKLPPEFDQEDWWEKEFKTFKWYKDHKLGEWADDYVDDHDWDYDDDGNVIMLNSDGKRNHSE